MGCSEDGGRAKNCIEKQKVGENAGGTSDGGGGSGVVVYWCCAVSCLETTARFWYSLFERRARGGEAENCPIESLHWRQRGYCRTRRLSPYILCSFGYL